MSQLEGTLEEFFKKAPALPENAKEAIVRFGPWIDLVLIVMTLPIVLLALGLSAAFLPFASLADPSVGYGVGFAWIFALGSLALNIFALPGLFARKKSGWNLLFYSTLMNAVYSIFTFNFFGLIIGTLISLYILFQIRSYYK